MKLLDGISKKTMMTNERSMGAVQKGGSLHQHLLCTRCCARRFTQRTAFKFPDMSQESHSHPDL